MHTADLPLLFNMTKCLFVALVMSCISIAGSVLLLVSFHSYQVTRIGFRIGFAVRMHIRAVCTALMAIYNMNAEHSAALIAAAAVYAAPLGIFPSYVMPSLIPPEVHMYIAAGLQLLSNNWRVIART